MDIKKLAKEAAEKNKSNPGDEALQSVSKEMWEALKKDDYKSFHKAFENSLKISKGLDDDG